MTDRTCNECKWLVGQDTGYSNWTVEGTDIDCIWGLNPGMPTDRWYEQNETCNFGRKCERFTAGDGVTFDVDGDVRIEHVSDLELQAALRLYERKPGNIIRWVWA